MLDSVRARIAIVTDMARGGYGIKGSSDADAVETSQHHVMSMDVMVQEHRIVTVVAMADGDSGIE